MSASPTLRPPGQKHIIPFGYNPVITFELDQLVPRQDSQRSRELRVGNPSLRLEFDEVEDALCCERDLGGLWTDDFHRFQWEVVIPGQIVVGHPCSGEWSAARWIGQSADVAGGRRGQRTERGAEGGSRRAPYIPEDGAVPAIAPFW